MTTKLYDVHIRIKTEKDLETNNTTHLYLLVSSEEMPNVSVHELEKAELSPRLNLSCIGTYGSQGSACDNLCDDETREKCLNVQGE